LRTAQGARRHRRQQSRSPTRTEPAMSQTVTAQHAAGRAVPGWLLTVWAALAALAVCVVAVFYTPIVPPAAWRSTDAAVVSLGRHAVPDDGLSL
jgi:hypothetical protein